MRGNRFRLVGDGKGDLAVQSNENNWCYICKERVKTVFLIRYLKRPFVTVCPRCLNEEVHLVLEAQDLVDVVEGLANAKAVV
ncbi:MAG: hypothetical protein AB1489_24715 [Acidobacteriota bacterium]